MELLLLIPAWLLLIAKRLACLSGAAAVSCAVLAHTEGKKS